MICCRCSKSLQKFFDCSFCFSNHLISIENRKKDYSNIIEFMNKEIKNNISKYERINDINQEKSLIKNRINKLKLRIAEKEKDIFKIKELKDQIESQINPLVVQLSELKEKILNYEINKVKDTTEFQKLALIIKKIKDFLKSPYSFLINLEMERLIKELRSQIFIICRDVDSINKNCLGLISSLDHELKEKFFKLTLNILFSLSSKENYYYSINYINNLMINDSNTDIIKSKNFEKSKIISGKYINTEKTINHPSNDLNRYIRSYYEEIISVKNELNPTSNKIKINLNFKSELELENENDIEKSYDKIEYSEIDKNSLKADKKDSKYMGKWEYLNSLSIKAYNTIKSYTNLDESNNDIKNTSFIITKNPEYFIEYKQLKINSNIWQMFIALRYYLSLTNFIIPKEIINKNNKSKELNKNSKDKIKLSSLIDSSLLNDTKFKTIYDQVKVGKNSNKSLLKNFINLNIYMKDLFSYIYGGCNNFTIFRNYPCDPSIFILPIEILHDEKKSMESNNKILFKYVYERLKLFYPNEDFGNKYEKFIFYQYINFHPLFNEIFELTSKFTNFEKGESFQVKFTNDFLISENKNLESDEIHIENHDDNFQYISTYHKHK